MVENTNWKVYVWNFSFWRDRSFCKFTGYTRRNLLQLDKSYLRNSLLRTRAKTWVQSQILNSASPKALLPRTVLFAFTKIGKFLSFSRKKERQHILRYCQRFNCCQRFDRSPITLDLRSSWSTRDRSARKRDRKYYRCEPNLFWRLDFELNGSNRSERWKCAIASLALESSRFFRPVRGYRTWVGPRFSQRASSEKRSKGNESPRNEPGNRKYTLRSSSVGRLMPPFNCALCPSWWKLPLHNIHHLSALLFHALGKSTLVLSLSFG